MVALEMESDAVDLTCSRETSGNVRSLAGQSAAMTWGSRHTSSISRCLLALAYHQYTATHPNDDHSN